MYTIKFRRAGQWFWTKKKCQWQSWQGQGDKLVLKLTDGTFYEIPKVSECEFRYTQDLLDVNKKKAEEEKAKKAAESKPQGT